jgi:hypothetical protein
MKAMRDFSKMPMNKTALRSALRLLAPWLLCVAGARGEDLTTLNGKVFRDVEIKDLDCEAITVSHRDGASRIPLVDLPAEIRKRFGPSELWRELRLRTAELESIKRELVTLRGERPRVAPPSSARTGSHSGPDRVVAVKPVPPMSSLPELKTSDVVLVEEIGQHYKTDPRTADQRYRRKVFRIEGRIDRFEEKLFVRRTEIILSSPEGAQRVVCELPFPEEFNAVYSTKGGQVLVGVSGNRREVRLMEVGQSVIFEGKCAGLQNGGIVFAQCRIVR